MQRARLLVKSGGEGFVSMLNYSKQGVPFDNNLYLRPLWLALTRPPHTHTHAHTNTGTLTSCFTVLCLPYTAGGAKMPALCPAPRAPAPIFTWVVRPFCLGMSC